MTPAKLAFLSVFIGSLPILVAVLASQVATWCGGDLSEASVAPCLVWGYDISKVLYTMFMCGWLGMFSVPLGGLGLMGSGIWALVRFVK